MVKRENPKKIEKEKSKKIEKEKSKKLKNPKKIEKEKSKKIEKIQKKEKEFVLVVLDKMCVFCLYPILDSQQYVKRDSCRRPILSGLLFRFNDCWTLGPFMSRFEFGPQTYPVMLSIYFIKSLGHFVLNVVPCSIIFRI